MKLEKLVPDTSVIIEGIISRKIESKELQPKTILIHEAVLAELEHMANNNRAIGFLGLDEIDRIRQTGNTLSFGGTKPKASEIRYASLGEIDAMIRDLAFEEGATLVTADKVQARIAQAKGIECLLIQIESKARKIRLDKFFDATTMSVHLNENVYPHAKKGVPGNWQFVKIGSKKLTRDEIREIANEILEETGIRTDGFVEIERPGSTIVQLSKYRIVITRPPFSDGWEITAVRPVKKLSLPDYHLSEKLNQRVSEQAEGILIAGAPGMGKSTFAQALAEFYASQEKIVKTVEAPRDLDLPDNITQYAISHGTPQEVHDILLLSRPDYTIFDEMRNTADFKLFADLRLAGIGLAGVVHATNPIDAIQRFVGRIELGVIPQVIDTVIFIKNGQVDKVLSLSMTVKVPSGMTEADLARPVVVVNDFETRKLLYELYSYGEETVVVPVRAETQNPAHKIASQSIASEFRHYSEQAKVEMTSDNSCTVFVPSSTIAKIIGKQGQNIEQIEKKLGLSIDVKELTDKEITGTAIAFDAALSKKHVVLYLDEKLSGKNVDIFLQGEYLITANIGKQGIIKLNKKSKIARILQDAVNMKENIKVVLKE
ncbi:MAG: PINc/VapC family ATPase [Candidatus Woesearchaeota archaeon]